MASNTATVEWMVKQLSGAGSVSAKKMFGEYGLYLEEKMVALVCDNRFFVKRTEAGYAYWGEHEEDFPYPGAKPLLVLDEDGMRDKNKLAELMRLTYEELPAPKKKSAKKVAGLG